MTSKDKTKKYIPVTIAFIAIAIFLFALLGGMLTQLNPEYYSEEQIAENTLRDFLGENDNDIELIGIDTTNHGDYYKFTSGDGGEYYVDAATRNVVRASFPVDWNESLEVLINMGGAEDIARKFIYEKVNRADIDGFDVTESKLLDHGAYKEYQFTFNEVKDDVFLFNSAIVSINPSNGEIISFIYLSKKTEVSLMPEVSEEEAIAIAAGQFDGIVVRETKARLVVGYPEMKEQKLLWNVMIEGEPEDYIMQGGTVVIDAVTGEVYMKSSFL